MNAKRLQFIVALLLFFYTSAFSQIKVACVGNSITYGYGIPNREVNSYPAQLGKILGSEWDVKNFGVSGATLLKQGDRPYWKQPAYDEAKAYNPDVVIIKLGTNDTKPLNWKFKNDFIPDYSAMITEFKSLPSKPFIFICLPVPAYPERWGIRDSIIKADLLPLVKKIAKLNKVKLIDLYTPMSHHAEWFPDKIHPNTEGAAKIAEVISRQQLKFKNKILRREK